MLTIQVSGSHADYLKLPPITATTQLANILNVTDKPMKSCWYTHMFTQMEKSPTPLATCMVYQEHMMKVMTY